MGEEGFADLWQGLIVVVVGEDVQQGAANEGHVGEQVGIA